MNTFIWTITILACFETIGQITLLIQGIIPHRTKTHMVCNMLMWSVFAIWGIVVVNSH